MNLRVAMFASEMEPYVKTGGLADVIGSLPQALTSHQLVEHIDVFIPYYREIHLKNLPIKSLPFEFKIKIGSRNYKGSVLQLKTAQTKLNINFIDNYKLFRSRSQLYVKDGKDYSDNLTRFIFFCRGVLKVISQFFSSKTYNVFHMNDWQTALIGLYTEISPNFKNTPLPLRVYTIHNLAYQGKFPKSQFRLIGVDSSYFRLMEFWGKINLMKVGIQFSEIITTVSPTYAREIQTEELGAGLSSLLKKKSSRLFGILNGVDYSIWNPEIDPLIPSNYSVDSMNGKVKCKKSLQQHFLLPESPSIPILVVVSRLVWQKGMELLLKVIEPFLEEERIQFVLLGVGDKRLEQKFKALDMHYNNAGIALTYNNHLAHQIEAGADIFLMPSRYEPSGLNDKYSLRYGTVPIAFKTGGLADGIIDYSSDPKNGTGFFFTTFEESHFKSAIERALKVFNSKSEWYNLQKRGMKQEFSWENAANEYLKIYQTRIP
ncbi:MAG: glycogen synthase [Candidatus Hodarchaeales archaeon]|jgi:starch synthase